jgi:hypothetical protein
MRKCSPSLTIKEMQIKIIEESMGETNVFSKLISEKYAESKGQHKQCSAFQSLFSCGEGKVT